MPGRADAGDAELLERGPAAEQHVRVEHRHLDRVGQRLLLRRRQLRRELRDHRVVAGEHDVAAAHLVHAPVAQVRHLHARRPVRPAPSCATRVTVLFKRTRTGRRVVVQLAVVHGRLHDRVHVVRARDGLRHQPRDQQARDRGVAVREVERVAALRGTAPPSAGPARRSRPSRAAPPRAPASCRRACCCARPGRGRTAARRASSCAYFSRNSW